MIVVSYGIHFGGDSFRAYNTVGVPVLTTAQLVVVNSCCLVIYWHRVLYQYQVIPELYTMVKHRSFTIEIHADFSEAPHLSSSIPQPKTDYSENQISSR